MRKYNFRNFIDIFKSNMRTKGYNLVFNSKFKSDLPDGINRRTKTNRIVSVRAG